MTTSSKELIKRIDKYLDAMEGAMGAEAETLLIDCRDALAAANSVLTPVAEIMRDPAPRSHNRKIWILYKDVSK